MIQFFARLALLALTAPPAAGTGSCACLGGVGYGNSCAHWDAPDEKPWCRVPRRHACGADDTFVGEGDHFWSHAPCHGEGRPFVPIAPLDVGATEARVKAARAALLAKYPARAFGGGALRAVHGSSANPRCDPLVAACRRLLQPGGELRIAAFGSSVTAGAAGVGAARSWVALVADALLAWVGGGGGGDGGGTTPDYQPRVRLQSVAQGGVGTAFPAAMLESLVDGGSFDVALWEYALNDVDATMAYREATLRLLVQRLARASSPSSPSSATATAMPPAAVGFVGMWDYHKWPPSSANLAYVQSVASQAPSASFVADFARFLVDATGGADGGGPVLDVRADGHHPNAIGHRMIADLVLFHFAGAMLAAMQPAPAATDCAGGGDDAPAATAPAGGGGGWPHPLFGAIAAARQVRSWVPFKPAFGRAVLPPPCEAARWRAGAAAPGASCAGPGAVAVQLKRVGEADAKRADRKFRAVVPKCRRGGGSASGGRLLTFVVPARATRLLFRLPRYVATSVLVDGAPAEVGALTDIRGAAPSGLVLLGTYLSHELRLGGGARGGSGAPPSSRVVQFCTGELDDGQLAVAGHAELASALKSAGAFRLLELEAEGVETIMHTVPDSVQKYLERKLITPAESDVLEQAIGERRCADNGNLFMWIVALF